MDLAGTTIQEDFSAGEESPLDFTNADHIMSRSLVNWNVAELAAFDGAIDKWLSTLTGEWLETAYTAWRSDELTVLITLIEAGLVEMQEHYDTGVVILCGCVWNDNEKIQLHEQFDLRLTHEGKSAKEDLKDALSRGIVFACVRGATPFTRGIRAEPTVRHISNGRKEPGRRPDPTVERRRAQVQLLTDEGHSPGEIAAQLKVAVATIRQDVRRNKQERHDKT
ncbi:helix-turn-helix domain-containing protein [Botrimarina hoheduenensis]|uniref:Uncharacterized protein n=1 Tax=Botrimarina hoheduenensis TaxID=2528000 RepID=A0A5C5WA62_9BACT|nr:helix-turn-helix domain-containing protein [Botrimarina hoheduenensis]TWT47183.1 hypothetical protein Pla111_07950 [Botrimarina hoheduenensis]